MTSTVTIRVGHRSSRPRKRALRRELPGSPSAPPEAAPCGRRLHGLAARPVRRPRPRDRRCASAEKRRRRDHRRTCCARSPSVSALLGTREIVILHHTECGMDNFDDDAFRAELAAESGQAPDWDVPGFSDVRADVRRSIEKVRDLPVAAAPRRRSRLRLRRRHGSDRRDSADELIGGVAPRTVGRPAARQAAKPPTTSVAAIPERVQRIGGQRRRVALRAEHDPLLLRRACGSRAGRVGVQPPLEVVALDDQRAGYLAAVAALPGRTDVDQQRPVVAAAPQQRAARPGAAASGRRRAARPRWRTGSTSVVTTRSAARARDRR